MVALKAEWASWCSATLDILFREAKDVNAQTRLVNELRLWAWQRQRYTPMQGQMFAT